MKIVRMVMMVMLISVMGYASSIARMQAQTCVDFTTYATGTNLGTDFIDSGMTFRTLGTGSWFINTQLGQPGLQFEDAGLTIAFPTPVTQVELQVEAFGNLVLAAFDSSGTVDKQAVPNDHAVHTVVLRGAGIVQVMITGGSNEAVLDSACTDVEQPPTGCTSFEEQKLSDTYGVGNAFVDTGVTVLVEDFEWSNGTRTSAGTATVEDGGMAAGSGNEIHINNVNLHFLLPAPTTHLTLKFGKYGGNLNIMIRGMFINFNDMAKLNGKTINGVTVSVVNAFGNNTGVLTLDGPLADFSIGGQEFWIDDLCFTPCREAKIAS